MLGKRLMMLCLSAMLSLTTLAFAAPAVTADEGHPNIIVQAVIHLENIAATGNYYKKANISVNLKKDIRHWVNNHGVGAYGVPKWVGKVGCTAEFKDWLIETRSLAKVGFRYYRGKATSYKAWPKSDRAAVRVRQMLIFRRVEGRQADAEKDFLNCIFDNMPLRLRLLLF